MADNFKIGAGLALDGEKEFKKAVTGINKDLTVLGSEMKKVTAQFDGNANSMEALTAKQDVYNKKADEQRKKIEVMTTALESAKKEFGENSDQVKNWQIKLNNAEADLAKTENALKETTDQIDNFGKEADETGKDVGKAGKNARDSGGDAQKGESGWSKLGSGLGKVAKAAGAAVAALAAAAAGAAAGAAVGLGKKVVGEYGELEQNLGGSEAVFGQYAASIQKTGEDAYKNLGVSQSEYLASANKVGALFQGAGIDQQRSLELTEMAMQRATDAASVMGIDSASALEAITGAAKGNYTMMDNLGVAMNETSLKAYALSKGLDYGDISADQSKKAELAMAYFFEKTAQYEGNFAKEASESITGSFGMLSASWKSMLAGFGNADADMDNLTKNLTDSLGTVINNLTPIINNLVAALPRVFDALVPALTSMLPQLLTAAASLFNSLLGAIIGLLPTLIPVAVEGVMTITQTLVDNLPLIVESAMTLISTLAQGIADALPELIPTIVDTVMLIVETLIDNIDLLIDASIAIIMGLATGLIDALPRLIEKIPVIIEKLVQAIVENLPKIIEMGITLIIKLAEGLIKAIPQLVKAIHQILKAIGGGLLSFVGSMGEIGLNLIKGLWKGISDAGAWLWEKISGFFDGVVKKIKNFFGIASPSKLFANLGEFMAEGLGEGFGDEMKSVTKDMNNAIPTSFDVGVNANGRIGSSGSSGTVGYGMAVSNIYMDSVLVASASSRAQYRKNATRARSYGVVPV